MQVQQCRACATRWFPPVLVCPACHERTFDRSSLDHVVVEQVTAPAGWPHAIATVRAADGLRLIARVARDTTPGQSLPAVDQADDSGAYVPSPPAME